MATYKRRSSDGTLNPTPKIERVEHTSHGNWQNLKVERSDFNTAGLGELYGKKVLKPIEKALADPYGIATGIINKSWRAMIPIRRAMKSPNDPANKGKSYDPAINGNVSINKRSRDSEVKSGKEVIIGDTKYIFRGNSTKEIDEHVKQSHDDHISWLNTNNNQIIIYNCSISPYEYIAIQNRPHTLDFKGETSWASVKSMGRNTPIYQYTGAEDVLQFNISWFNTDIDKPEEVISKCRLLESWSKANGYLSAPPVLTIQWGGTPENNLLIGQTFILISATYTLRNFNNGARKFNGGKITYENLGLWPSVATQELIFKRVSTSNITYQDILPTDNKELIISRS